MIYMYLQLALPDLTILFMLPNALYALCKMFSGSHAPGIQTLTDENMQFKYLTVGVTSSASERVYNIQRKRQKNAT